MLRSMSEAIRRVEDTVMNTMVYGEDTDKSMTGIKAGDYEAKHFYRYFSLGDKVGQGASLKVYKGTIKKEEKKDGATVYAIKRVRKFQLKERKKKALFREVQILRELNHPNVVDIYQFYPKDPAYYYVVLEYLPGGELFDRIVKKDTYNEREVRDVIKVLVDALAYLHACDVVHRDLKPGNILLSSAEGDGISSVKIADFSMAMSVVDGPTTTDGGDPVNVAPEMLLARPYLTSPDMWSLGLISYIILTGTHPFYERDTTKMFCRVAAGDYQFKPEDWRNTSTDAQDFISKLLVVDMNKRMTAEQAKSHPWLLASGQSLEVRDLGENLQEFQVFNAKIKLRAAMKAVLAARRMFSWLPTNEFSKAYELGDKLGEGAYGTVFKATPLTPESFSDAEETGAEELASAPRVCAVKRIKREGLSDKLEQYVIAEANIMRELDHPNVVSIYDFYQDDPKHFYMVLEFMSGGDLFDRIVQKQFYNEAEARDMCLMLLEAMKYIHGQGIVHRDLKPENLLLASPSDDSSIRIADFGFAVSVRDGYVTDQCGTPGYVAPEILRAEPYGASVDMWSTGVIIYVILAGYCPFDDENQNRLYRKIKAGHFRFDPEYWNDVSSEAKDLIRKLLTVDPEIRITAAEACEHPWLSTARGNLIQHDLGAGLENLKIFNAKRKLRAAIRSVLLARGIARSLDLRYY